MVGVGDRGKKDVHEDNKEGGTDLQRVLADERKSAGDHGFLLGKHPNMSEARRWMAGRQRPMPMPTKPKMRSEGTWLYLRVEVDGSDERTKDQSGADADEDVAGHGNSFGGGVNSNGAKIRAGRAEGKPFVPAGNKTEPVKGCSGRTSPSGPAVPVAPGWSA